MDECITNGYVEYDGKWMTPEEAEKAKSEAKKCKDAIEEAFNKVAPEIKMPKNKAEMHALFAALSKKDKVKSFCHPSVDRAEFFEYFSAWRDFEEHRRKLDSEADANGCEKPDFSTVADKIDKLMIVYVNVGGLPSKEAEEFVEKAKSEMKLNSARFPVGYEVIWIPVRNSDTRIEVIKL